MSVHEVRRLSEDALVERARAGDREAFGELVRIHQNEVFTLALRIVGDPDEAADVAQDAFVRAWRAFPRFRGDAQYSTWMYRIVVNAAFTHRGRRTRRRIESLDGLHVEPVDAAPSPERWGESALAQRPIEMALLELPVSVRAVVVLKDVYDWSHAEISRELDITVAAAKVRLHRGRKRLRGVLMRLQQEQTP